MSTSRSNISRCRVLTIIISIVIILLFSLDFLLRHKSFFSNRINYLSADALTKSASNMADNPLGSCPQNPPLNTNKRTEFGRLGCTVYAYPSSGGILIKEVDVVDMLFLRLDRFTAATRSPNIIEEDDFCTRMRMLGAVWWADEQEWIDVQLGLRGKTELESRRLVFGWPTKGPGVWVLRYENERAVPRDFGKVSLALDMDERCRIMRQYGAQFYDDPETVEELKRRP